MSLAAQKHHNCPTCRCTEPLDDFSASVLNGGLCGCGKPAIYETMNGMACNKHMRCMTYEEQRELIQNLTTAMLKTNATIEELRELRKVTQEMMNRPFDI